MGDNIHLGDRDGVRTPMQWSLDRNGGFSRADPAALVLPPIMDPLYGYPGGQRRGAGARSALAAQLDAAHARRSARQQRAFGRGTFRLLYPSNRRVMAYLREYARGGRYETILCVANCRAFAQAVELDLSGIRGPGAGRDARRRGVSADRPAALPADAAALRLLLVRARGAGADAGLAHAGAGAAAGVSTPSSSATRSRSCWRPHARTVLEREVLPLYLPKRRWFSGKDAALEQMRASRDVRVPGSAPPVLLAEIEVQHRLAVWTATCCRSASSPKGADATALPQQLALARVRRGRRVGFLTDAFCAGRFCAPAGGAAPERRAGRRTARANCVSGRPHDCAEHARSAPTRRSAARRPSSPTARSSSDSR